jgi:hypothetical protein
MVARALFAPYELEIRAKRHGIQLDSDRHRAKRDAPAEREHHLLHPVTEEKGAVGASEVARRHAFGYAYQLDVLAGYGGIRDDDVVTGTRADHAAAPREPERRRRGGGRP